ncbi:hypothetical protein GJAV_G00140380 [Gymnothorax javanicus]|nr:hypothetical protein GJAV_G00140380 [Gymnothorax javanicus]
MKRNLSENLHRPTAGCLPVPLFNQKRRNRLPLTSNPSESEFYQTDRNEFSAAESLASPSLSSGKSGNPDCYGPNCKIPGGQNRPAVNAAGRGLGHPNKTGQLRPEIGQQRPTAWRGPGVQSDTKPSGFSDLIENVHNKPKPSQTCRQTGQLQPTAGCQWKDSNWTLKATDHSSQFKVENVAASTKSVTQYQKSAEFQRKPVVDNSLRILTTVIEGMKHWSKFKDRVAFLFEVFATLDSAVTAGNHGAKSFLLRDGKDTVHCVFYETDRDLPRLIRGQVHRCVGNYDRRRDVFTCVSVRPASSSEQRNAQESVKVSDMEMRGLVKFFSEI